MRALSVTTRDAAAGRAARAVSSASSLAGGWRCAVTKTANFAEEPIGFASIQPRTGGAIPPTQIGPPTITRSKLVTGLAAARTAQDRFRQGATEPRRPRNNDRTWCADRPYLL